MKNINEILDITSDLHTDFIYNNFKSIYWKNWVLKQKNDYLVICWDINEDIWVLQKSFDDIIDNTKYKNIITTFWNHDLRISAEDLDCNITNSIQKYEFLINHFHHYRDKIHVIDKEDFMIPNSNYIITGNMWWYNYTINPVDKFYLTKYFNANFDKMSFWSTIYNDKLYIKFNEKIKWNIGFSNYLEDKLIQRLEKLKWYSNNHEIIVMSHIKPSNQLEKNSKYFLEYSMELWEEIIKDKHKWVKNYNLENIYWNAFFVNNNLSKIYEIYNVKYAIYWHTHFHWEQEINWIKYISNALWYYWLS